MGEEHIHRAPVPRRMFWLYRPTAPSIRAQSIQTVHAAHASARRGHQVTLCVQAAGAGTTSTDVLGFYGLGPVPELRLIVLSASNTLASAQYRLAFARWALGGGTAVARSKRHAAQAVRWAGGRFDLIVEAHEVDSVQLDERGQPSEEVRELERRVLGAARGVICNCEGTRDLLVREHPTAPPTAVLHNATHRDRIRAPAGRGEGIGYTGSTRSFKDPGSLARASRALGRPIHLVGPEPDPALVAASDGWLRFEPALAHRAIPDRLARFEVLVLPVAPGLFGEQLTSPLKLWDYLASGRPIVAADTPAIRAAAGDAFEPYPAGDGDALAAAIRRVSSDEARASELVARARTRIRTWDDRARELDAFLDGL